VALHAVVDLLELVRHAHLARVHLATVAKEQLRLEREETLGLELAEVPRQVDVGRREKRDDDCGGHRQHREEIGGVTGQLHVVLRGSLQSVAPCDSD